MAAATRDHDPDPRPELADGPSVAAQECDAFVETATKVLTVATGERPDDARHYLSVVEGDRAGRLIELGAPAVLGRAADCDVVLAATGVSSHHCRVSLVAGQLLVEDLGSTNGVSLDGVRLAEPTLVPVGAVVQIGRALLRHVVRDAVDVEHQAWLDEELAKAAAYVIALLPEPLDTDHLRIVWSSTPSERLGGDGFGYERLPDGRLALYVLDVCGHGPGVALHAASVVNLLRGRTLHADFTNPAHVLAELNGALQMDDHGGMYFTLWYGVFDPATRRVEFASAGHPAPVVRRRCGAIEALVAKGLAVGMLPDITYQSEVAQLAAGDRVYLFTDGAFEVRCTDGTQWTRHDLETRIADAGEDLGAEPERLAQAVRDVTGSGPPEDDVTLVVVELR